MYRSPITGSEKIWVRLPAATLSADLDVLFSEVTVNGQPHSSTTFEGTVNITPRPIAKVKLYKYEFKKEGASDDMIAKAILADLLLKNPDMKGAYISSVTLVPAIGRDLYSYTVVFNPNDNIQKIEVSNEDGGLIIPIEWGGYTTATYLRSVRLTDNGQSLAEYPSDQCTTASVGTSVRTDCRRVYTKTC